MRERVVRAVEVTEEVDVRGLQIKDLRDTGIINPAQAEGFLKELEASGGNAAPMLQIIKSLQTLTDKSPSIAAAVVTRGTSNRLEPGPGSRTDGAQ